ncbi:MAG TPA: hypothetical protein ENK08_05235 [Chloroflexi bacterium]|nr:hypothetical protein [Chloroflexota bacterium]
MRKAASIVSLVSLIVLLAGVVPVFAQGGDQPQEAGQGLVFFAKYPSHEVAIGDTVMFDLTLRATTPQTVRLDVDGLPEGWTATFRGSGKIVHAVYVEPGNDASVDLRIELPSDVEPNTYQFSAVARGAEGEVSVPLEVIVQEKLPPSLQFDVDLPTLRGTSNTTFRFNVTLKNEGDEETTVNLVADAPPGFEVTFKLTGQEVTSVLLGANESKRLSVEARPYTELPAGSYPIDVVAQGGEAVASITLTAEVTGQPDLNVTGVDGRLSGQAYVGRETTLKLLIQNTGSAPARGVELSASQPSGWKVEFDPQQIDEIPAGDQVEVTMKVRPSQQAIAGDYMVTVRARPEDGATESVDFRITVKTSTMWGLVGVAIIAVAVFVVAQAVMRFGRR